MPRFHETFQSDGMIGLMEGVTENDVVDDPCDDKDQRGHHDMRPPVFTMREAAEVAGVSVSTLRRRREDLIAAGAGITESGWRVPMTALIGAGLIDGEGPRREEAAAEAVSETKDEPQQNEQREDDRSGRVEELLEALRETERQRDEWRRRAEIAEAVSEERRHSLDALRAANESERLALRMLTAGDTPRPAEAVRQEERPAQRSMERESPSQGGSSEQQYRDGHEAPRRRGFWDRMMGR